MPKGNRISLQFVCLGIMLVWCRLLVTHLLVRHAFDPIDCKLLWTMHERGRAPQRCAPGGARGLTQRLDLQDHGEARSHYTEHIAFHLKYTHMEEPQVVRRHVASIIF